ncbi:MAG: CoA transferase, partial [Bryobacteraceae bacterium]
MPEANSPGSTPLEGLVVLDFSHALAGPYCTMLMAQYGARVYKIESPEGDLARTWGPPFVETGTGEHAAFFLGLNPGKKGVAIDLKTPEGLALCLELIEHADILIENMRPGTMTRLGLGYEAARLRNPRLVYCAISGYGQDGPRRDDPALDLVLQASSGLISMTGSGPDAERVRCGHSVADISAGMFGLIGILMALQWRERTGEGRLVDVSMFDGMLSAMASNFANFMGSGNPPEPMGTAFPTIVPYRGFPAADREIVIAVATEKLWEAFCPAIDRRDLAAHPDYATNRLRVKNRGVLEPLLTEIFRAHPAAYWEARLKAAGIPCSPVRELDAVAADPQTAARAMLQDAAGFTVTGLPVKLSGMDRSRQRRPAPCLGEH